ncbi:MULTISPECIES: hypothetical protein [Acidithiobacillus]|uniref:hypothetical protein n=1 Tax=Acidithiobacillus ferrivorans TaxID=160808 RepID=UPI001C0723B7|nr:hypothetical protein [Acidithiobacillus ferrivorans]MBU2850732.1 hypothetical protein [Acidithiobacillus ferrivorans]
MPQVSIGEVETPNDSLPELEQVFMIWAQQYLTLACKMPEGFTVTSGRYEHELGSFAEFKLEFPVGTDPDPWQSLCENALNVFSMEMPFHALERQLKENWREFKAQTDPEYDPELDEDLMD